MRRTFRFNADFRASRRPVGAAAVECAFVLPVTALMLFALLDLGIAAVRYNTLADASRRIAREAIIHGSLSPQESQQWGPDEFTGTIADESSVVAPARRVLPTMDEDLVVARVTWPDAGNAPRDRVRVELRYRHEPLVPSLFVWGPIDLSAITVMRIVN